MKKTNKIYIYLIIIGLLTIMIGAYIKISTDLNVDFLLIIGMLFAVISVLGLLYTNFGKIKEFLS